MNHVYLSQMNEWINSLTSEELIGFLSFQFVVEVSTKKSSFHNDSLHASESHEFHLLCQMLEMQLPPPTPIHPRALWYKPASAKEIPDGKGEEKNHLRFKRPRLFQFIDRCQDLQADLKDDLNLAQLPAEIADIVRKENGILPGVASGNRYEQRKEKGRMKKFGGKSVTPSRKFYDVLARSFVSAWGEVLSIGSTKKQRQADADIMNCTRIHYGCRMSNSNVGNNIACCTFYIDTGEFKKSPNLKDDVLNIIRTASRGKFLSMPPQKNSGNTQVSFFAPWFHPTSEWFSLPMYLSSRFEAALWNSFLQKGKDAHYSFPRTVLEDISLTLRNEQFLLCLLRSISEYVRQSIFSEIVTSGKSRDLILHSVLYSHLQSCYCTKKGLHQFICDGNYDLKSITSITLVNLRTPVDNLRLGVVKILEEHLSRETENELLRSVQSVRNSGSNKLGRKKKKVEEKEEKEM